MVNALYIAAAIGIFLSAYTLYIEYQAAHHKNYKALCDISDKMSCTKTFSSDYGKMFGLSNAWPGLLYYLMVMGLTFYGRMDLVFYLAILGTLVALYLAYLLYFKVKNFCLVCNGIYLVNILLLIFSWQML